MSAAKIENIPIELPLFKTIVDPIPQERITHTVSPNELIGLYTRSMKAMRIAEKIDPERLVETKAGKVSRMSRGPTPYTVKELKEIASELGVKLSLRRADMVRRLRSILFGENLLTVK